MLTNAQIAELLALDAAQATPPANRALKRASRRAFLWPEEAQSLVEQERTLTELAGVGPYIARLIHQWLEQSADFVCPKPPDIRTGFLTWTEAESVIAEKPAWSAEIKGDLQMHTTWSDGEGSVRQMAEAASQRNYEYISITDHANGLKIAGGINEQQLAQQTREIEEVNDELRRSRASKPLRILRSIELNLSPLGESDMESAALARLDVVLGCFHSALRRKEDQTDRYIAALRNPDIQILGHPRGRIYNHRLGLRADWSKVFAVAAELDKAIEIDCYPDRQDISPDLVRLARKEGCRISLGTDHRNCASLPSAPHQRFAPASNATAS